MTINHDTTFTTQLSATIISILLLYSLIEHVGIIAVPLAMLISTGIIGAPMLLTYQARLINSMNFNKTILSYFLITLIASALKSVSRFRLTACTLWMQKPTYLASFSTILSPRLSKDAPNRPIWRHFRPFEPRLPGDIQNQPIWRHFHTF